MNVFAGPMAIAALLLLAGGAAKARAPGDTARALRAVGVPAGPRIVRAGAVLEIAVGVGALVAASPVPIALVAISYLAFSAFVVQALRVGTTLSSCGCFGKIETPPSRVHIVIDLLIVAMAAVVVVAGTDVSIPTVLRAQPLAGLPFLLLVGVGSGLVFLAFTSLPRTFAAVRALR
jgi:hypothetical protein